MEELKTTLYSSHLKHKARMVPFAGYSMPVLYTSIKEEHLWVRNHCGVFDVSHMAEIFVSGTKAFSFLQSLMTNNLDKIRPGKCIYTLICNVQGHILDDVIIYWLDETEFMIVVNASNRKKIYDWMLKKSSEDSNLGPELLIEDKSDEFDLLAVQGAQCEEVLYSLFGYSLKEHPLFSHTQLPYMGQTLKISKTGYTGEKGVEIFCRDKETTFGLFDQLLSHPLVRPIGLGARDTLRLEVCFPLYGHELNDTVHPFDAGLHFAVDMNKDSFIGKKALSQIEDTRSRLYALKAEGRGILREGYEVYQNGKCIGNITSGSYLPSLDMNGALAYLNHPAFMIGDSVDVLIRQQMIPCKIITKPFLQPYYRRKA